MSVGIEVVGLDIGTTKVCAVVGGRDGAGNFEVRGVGTALSHGLRKGVVVNIDATVASIGKAIEDAELMAGIEIDNVYVGIAGGHIEGKNTRGVIAVSSKDKEIGEAEVDRVIDAARAIPLDAGREVVHVLPQEFIVDHQDGIKDPIGMCGVRLEAEIHIVTGATTSVRNLVRSVERRGLIVNDIVLQPLASSNAVLSEDEKELGCIVIDIGGGTTDVVVYVDGAVWHTGVLSVGGNHITNDITVGLRTPLQSAEAIKRKHGCALRSLVDPSEVIEVPSVGDRAPDKVARTNLAEIIEPRVQEIFGLVNKEIQMSGFRDLISAGVIITGGAAIMDGMVEVAADLFRMPVRLGTPRRISGLTDVVSGPAFSTAVGLCQYGLSNQDYDVSGSKGRGFFGNLKNKVRSLLKEFF